MISSYSRNFIGKGMSRFLVLRDPLIPILFYILEFKIRKYFNLRVFESKTFSLKVPRWNCTLLSWNFCAKWLFQIKAHSKYQSTNFILLWLGKYLRNIIPNASIVYNSLCWNMLITFVFSLTWEFFMGNKWILFSSPVCLFTEMCIAT